MQKKLLFALIIFSLQSCISTQNYPRKVQFWLDENKNEVSQKEFKSKWGKDDGYSRWDEVEGNKRTAYLSKPVYETFEGSYEGLQTILENISNKEYSNNTTFLIEYVFKDDLCTSKVNNWTKSATIQIKKN